MAWIKRNLIFVIIAVVALALLVTAGIYIFKNWQRNGAALATLNETYTTLQQLNNAPILPGNDKVDNIAAARAQQGDVTNWVNQLAQYFQPIPPIPNPPDGVVTDAQFAGARDHTLNQLQIEADKASVLVPPQYSFSFQAERPLVRFAPGGLVPLATQLGEVKEICEILFSAKINSLDNLRRARVSDDDANGPQSDYLDEPATTNDLAIFTPYQMTFRCFSQDLANVLEHFASSPHEFIVKGINVQPAEAASAVQQPNPQAMGSYLPQQQQQQYPQPPARPAYNTMPPGRGGLQTVLDEQLLSVTIEVELVKLLPQK